MEGDSEGIVVVVRVCCHVIVTRWERTRERGREGGMSLWLSPHVKEEGKEGEDKAWARHCHCHVIVIACEGGRERSGWVRTRDW